MSRRPLAPFERRSLAVRECRALGAYRLLRCADPIGPRPWPGQFYMLSAGLGWERGEGQRPYLPRALSFARAPGDELHFLLHAVGPGTARLAALRAGESVQALGPLGLGFAAPNDGRPALLVGGGVGIAPLAAWQDTLGATGQPPKALLGFRDAAHALAAPALFARLSVATDDGSAGHHGPVTELLEAELERDRGLVVYACGPPAMLEAVRRICLRFGAEGQLALESGMACGFGSCWGCVVPLVDGNYARLCVDGPVLDLRALATADVPWAPGPPEGEA